MEPEAERELREDAVGQAISRALITLEPRADSPTWHEIDGRARRVRQRRRAVRVGAFAPAVLAAVLVVALIRNPDDSNTIAADHGPTVPAELAPPVEGMNPTLRSLFELASCDSSGDLAAWSASALRPYGDVSPANAQSVELQEVATHTPVLRRPAGATCTSALRLDDAWAWEVQGANGTTLARFVAIPRLEDYVPRRMTRKQHYYHQEWLASAQGFQGFIRGDRLEAVVVGEDASNVVVGEVVGLDARNHADGVPLLQRLYLEPVVPIRPGLVPYTPSVVPRGFGLCAREAAPPTTYVVIYCNGEGESLRVSSVSYDKMRSGRDDRRTTVNTFVAEVSRLRGGQRRVTVRLPGKLGAVSADATQGIRQEQVLETLASIPFLDPRSVQSFEDSKALIADVALRSILESHGATKISITDDSIRPQRTLSYSFTGPGGGQFAVTFTARDSPGTFEPPGGRGIWIGDTAFAVGTEAALITTADGQVVSGTSQEIFGFCNAAYVRIIADAPEPNDQAAAFARAIIPAFGCGGA